MFSKFYISTPVSTALYTVKYRGSRCLGSLYRSIYIFHHIPYQHISSLTGIRISFIGETVATGKQHGTTRCKILPINQRTGEMEDAEPRLFNSINPGEVSREMPALQNIMGFDVIECASIDSMHTVFIGAVKALFMRWFKTPSKETYYMGKAGLDLANKIINRIKPMEGMQRSSGKRADLHTHWKAIDWRNWFYLISAMVLDAAVHAKMLHKKYLIHWLLFVRGVSYLDSEIVTKDDIERANYNLRLFVKQMPVLYGKRWVTGNYHLLLHLPQSVEYLGPLWSTSLFIHESFNQQILNGFRPGTQGMMQQIFERFQWISMIPHLYSSMRPIIPSSPAYRLAESFLPSSGRAGVPEPSGKQSLLNTEDFVGILCASNSVDIVNTIVKLTKNAETVASYSRVHLNGRIYTTASYDENHNWKKGAVCLLLTRKITVKS